MDIEMRPWTIEDNEVVVEWVKKDPSILTSMMMPGGLNEFQVRSSLLKEMDQPNRIQLAVLRDDEVVATVAVFQILPDGSATGSILVSPDYRDGFTAMRVSKEAVALAFNGMGLSRLDAIVSEENEKALQLARLMGFKDRGVRFLQITKDDQ